MGLHIVLHEPVFPANTGNIARTCLAANATLHLVHPLGFSTDDKMVKRAGLDYWQHVQIEEHDCMTSLYEKYQAGTYYYIENFGTKYYTDVDYSNIEEDIFLVFGSETSGIPRSLLEGKEDHCLRVHMSNTDKVRSLNLGNTAAIVIYEALRQRNFHGLK